MNVSYDYYKIFYYAAKYGSFTKAAQAILNNQPNITRAMKALESELGCTLFVRSNRGITLTPEGERLYQKVSVAIQAIEAGEQEIMLNKTLQSGIVNVAVSETALHGVLLPLLGKYKELYPGVKIKISNCSTPQAINDIKNGLADFALITSPIGDPDGLKISDISDFNMKIVCGTNYKDLKDQKLSLKKLSEYPIISLGSGTKTYDLYCNWFTKFGISFSPDIEVETSDQLMPLVKENLGIAFVPEYFVNCDKDKDAFYELEIKEKLPERSICIVTKKDKVLNIASKKLVSLIEGKDI